MLTCSIGFQKSVQAYQQQQNQAVPTVSEIPSKPVWETVPAKNFAIDLKRLKAENVASMYAAVFSHCEADRTCSGKCSRYQLTDTRKQSQHRRSGCQDRAANDVTYQGRAHGPNFQL
jgi:hypothetical protein